VAYQVSFGKQTISYNDQGSGEVLVFLHGWHLSKETWGTMLQHYTRKGYRCIAIDLPGFGESSTDGIWTMADYGRAVAKVLSNAGVSECTVIGHSFGAKCAVMLASQRPSLVKKLILVSGNLGLARRNLLWLPINLVLRARLAANMKQTYRLTHGFSFAPELKGLAMPVLAIHGIFDTVVPRRNSTALVRHVPHAKVVPLKAWHVPHKERPELFRQSLDGFIRNSRT
jgi:pimeloyl-ACP methyl ester carboxylesterase